MQDDPQRDTEKRHRCTGKFVEGVPQSPMSSQNQGIYAASPDTGIDLFDDAASESSPRGTATSLARRATQKGVGVPVQTHEDWVSEVTRLRESFVHVQTALDQSVTERNTERKQLRDILDQVQRARKESSTELAQLRGQISDRSTRSINDCGRWSTTSLYFMARWSS
uniref:Uncharacterized protein n=1 Tax=Hyaloperonospora arabidopsidis (strain Emoy2) TaxID=559515 RepID=M4BDS7_HYAAE